MQRCGTKYGVYLADRWRRFDSYQEAARVEDEALRRQKMPHEEAKDLPAVRKTTLTPDSPAAMLTAAIEKGIDAQGIKTLAEVFEHMQAKNAEREFNEALSAFQAECPIILKKKEIDFPTKSGGTFRSHYAEMDTIIDDTRELRGKYGFSHSFDREVTDKQIRVVCILRHRGGHQTSTPFAVPLPKDNKLSEAHAVAGAVTFCERYAFRGALGITTGIDHDGKELTSEPISEEQRHTLDVLIEETKANIDKFWEYAGIARGRLAELPARDFAKVQSALLQRKAKMQEAKK